MLNKYTKIYLAHWMEMIFEQQGVQIEQEKESNKQSSFIYKPPIWKQFLSEVLF